MGPKKFTVAVVGATGVVGAEMLKVLGERKFPVAKIVPLASEKSLGMKCEFDGEEIPVQALDENSFRGVDIALFSAGGDISKKYAPIAVESGAVVIDNTSAFRMERDVPLVVPEVNPGAIKNFKKRGIIANPNCSTIQMVIVLAPLHAQARIKRVVVATYQSVSGAGKEAMEELSAQSVALFSSKECRTSVFPHRIAFNCIPHIDVFLGDGSTKEEEKMVRETKKIMGDDSIGVVATTVRVPVFFGHSEAVNIEFASPMLPATAREILEKSPGVSVIDDPKHHKYPMAINSVGKDDVFVGRIRRDETVAHGLSMWIVADNIRKGAALNAVQIAEILAREHL